MASGIRGNHIPLLRPLRTMCLKHQSLAETAFHSGVALIGIGVLVFFGATPKSLSTNPVGSAWLAAAILVVAGIILVGVHRHSTKRSLPKAPSREPTK